MKHVQICVALLAVLAFAGCSKKKDEAPGTKAAGSAAAAAPAAPAAAASGLAWTPMNYADMSEKCKKALACCEDVAKAEGAKTDEDYNGKCSGPAVWKDEDCDADLKARAAEGKPLPDSCK